MKKEQTLYEFCQCGRCQHCKDCVREYEEALQSTPQPTGEIGELLDTIMDMLQPYHEYEKLKANIAMSQVHKLRTAIATLERERDWYKKQRDEAQAESLAARMSKGMRDTAISQAVTLQADNAHLTELVGELVEGIRKGPKGYTDHEDNPDYDPVKHGTCISAEGRTIEVPRCCFCDTKIEGIDIECESPSCPAVRAHARIKGDVCDGQVLHKYENSDGGICEKCGREHKFIPEDDTCNPTPPDKETTHDD